MPHEGKHVENYGIGFCTLSRYYFAFLYLFLDFINEAGDLKIYIPVNSHIIIVPFQSVNK